MLRILLLSDIHFIHCEPDENDYRSLETAFVEAMDEVRDAGGVNQILICGDIAYKGKESEYQKAEEFLDRVFEHLGCDEMQTQVYVVPGNHDIDRSVNASTRLALRSTLLDLTKADDFVKNAKHNERATIRTIYSPFECYHKFANKHSSVDGIAESILTGSDNFNNRSFRREVDLGMIDDYIIRLHCLNSALLCDKNDVNDPRDMKEDEHKLYIPKFAYNVETSKTLVNISMMHHPHAWFVNESELKEEFDHKFKLQIFGHVHTQSISQEEEGKSPIRLQLGSLQPDKGGDPVLYAPVYNLLEIDIVKGVLKVNVICYSWDKEKFIKNNAFSYTKTIALPKKFERTAKQKKEVKKMKAEITNKEELYKLRYRFFSSQHIKEIITDIDAKKYDDSKPEYANAMTFFKSIASSSVSLQQLNNALTQIGE